MQFRHVITSLTQNTEAPPHLPIQVVRSVACYNCNWHIMNLVIWDLQTQEAETLHFSCKQAKHISTIMVFPRLQIHEPLPLMTHKPESSSKNNILLKNYN